MTSSIIEPDQRSVLQIVRTCFNIYLTTRSKINEATAQGSLSQIVQSIFSKMEQKMVRSKKKWNEREITTFPHSEFNQWTKTCFTRSFNHWWRSRTNCHSRSSRWNDRKDLLRYFHRIRSIDLSSSLHLDEARQELTTSTQSTNDIIEDTHGELQFSRRTTMTDDQSLDEASTMKENRTSEEISADKHYKNAFHVFRALCKLSDREIKDKGNIDPRYLHFSFVTQSFRFI